MSAVDWIILGFLTVMMGIGGIALYFSSDHAQEKYNPKNL